MHLVDQRLELPIVAHLARAGPGLAVGAKIRVRSAQDELQRPALGRLLQRNERHRTGIGKRYQRAVVHLLEIIAVEVAGIAEVLVQTVGRLRSRDVRRRKTELGGR